MGDLGKLRTFYESGAFEAGWNLYQTELAEWPGPEWHYYGARCAMRLRNHGGARMAVEQASALRPTGALLGQLRFTRSLLVQEIGEYKIAVGLWEETIRGLTSEYPELAPVMEGACWNNLGLTLRILKRHTEALDAYHRAANILRREGPEDALRIALLNINWLQCIQGNAGAARVALEEAAGLARNQKAHWQHRLGEAFLLTVEGYREQALRLCEEIGRTSEAAPEVNSHACWLAGRIALEAGHYELAESLARQGIAVGDGARDANRCMHDASDLLRSVVEARTKQGA